MQDKWNWAMDEKTENIYRNLCSQIEKVFRHTRQGSIQTRYRYKDGVQHFAKFLAETYKKQNLNKIQAKHLQGYVEQMQEWGYSKSYVTTNLSAIRYLIDLSGGDSKKLPNNRDLAVNARTKEDRIGSNKAWEVDEVKRFTNYAESIGQTRYADMVKVGFAYGLRIHEVARLDKNDLLKSLNENQLTVKGKGGLVRNVPLHDSELIRWLYNITPVGEKVFVKQDEKAHHVINSLQSFIIRNQDKFVENIDNSRHFHGLRHLYAQTRYKVFVEEGLNERQAKLKVAHELGHFRAEITEVYLK
jgi:site-specific recombinase XerD